jgi:hypothetical protein
MPSLIGTEQNQVPTNAMLGSSAYMPYEQVLTSGAGITVLAAASTTDIGTAASNVVQITGTTTITALGNAAAGAERTLLFSGALTLTYNATSLILPSAANITTVAGDAAKFVSLGSGNWDCVSYQTAVGQVATQAEAQAGTSNTTLMTPLRVSQSVSALTPIRGILHTNPAGETLTDKNASYSINSSSSYTLPDITGSVAFNLVFPSNTASVPSTVYTLDGWSIQTTATAGVLSIIRPFSSATPHGTWGSNLMTPPTLSTATITATFGTILGTAQIDTGLVVIVYRNSTTVYAVACNTNTNTFGTPVTMMAYNNATGFGVWANSTTSFVVVCNHASNAGSAQAGSISGTTITLGTAAGLSNDVYTSVKLANNLYVVDTNNNTGLRAFSVSGTSITVGSAVAAGATSSNNGHTAIVRVSGTEFLLAALLTGSGVDQRQLSVRVGSISGTTITLNTASNAATNIIANSGMRALIACSEGSSYIAVCQNATPTSGSFYGISVSGTTATLGTVTTRANDLPATYTPSYSICQPKKGIILYNSTTCLFGHLSTGPYAVTISGTTLTFGSSGGGASVEFLTDFTGTNFYAVGASTFDKISVSGTTITSAWQVAASPTIIISDTLTNKAVNYSGQWYTWNVPGLTALTSSKWIDSRSATNLTLSGPIL